jgi:Transposase DDE domain
MWSAASKANAKSARPPPSSIVKALRALKRGRCVDPHGYDAGDKIKGKKRHILVDTLGLLLHAIVHPADIQDRDGGIFLLATLFGMYPFLKKLFAAGGYQGPEFQKALAKLLPQLKTEIAKRSDQTLPLSALLNLNAALFHHLITGQDAPKIGGRRVLRPHLRPLRIITMPRARLEVAERFVVHPV